MLLYRHTIKETCQVLLWVKHKVSTVEARRPGRRESRTEKGSPWIKPKVLNHRVTGGDPVPTPEIWQQVESFLIVRIQGRVVSPCGSVVRTLCSWEPRFDPWSGNEGDHTYHS